MLEGDDPLVLTACDVLKVIDEFFYSNSVLENTLLVVEEVHEMLELIYRPRMNSYNDTRDTCHDLQNEINRKEDEVKGIHE